MLSAPTTTGKEQAEPARKPPVQAGVPEGRRGGGTAADAVLSLQRGAGNRAVSGLITSRPGDRFEREADVVADSVNRYAPVEQGVDAPQLQMKSTTYQAPSSLPDSVRTSLASPGHALDPSARSLVEPHVGMDLSHVRIHTGEAASDAAASLSAKAFTTGSDIVFANGQYQPHTSEGRGLIAHEAAHVAQQGTTVGQTPAVQCKEETPAAKTESGPHVVRIYATVKEKGVVRALLSDGSETTVYVLTNSLDDGTYTVSAVGKADGPKNADFVRCESQTFSWRQPVTEFQADATVEVVIKAFSETRFSRLPMYIQLYLLAGQKDLGPAVMDRLADEGEAMVKAGITAADLALAVSSDSVIEVEGEAPPDADMVESLRRRGFSDFPSREEFYKRLANEIVNSNDYRRWWTKEDVEAYWKDLPELAEADWEKYADRHYTEAKQAEAAKWMEAFRRIDAAAGAVNAIAVATLVVAGGFAGAEVLALPAIEIPALPATIQGVQTATWAKTAFAAGLSASYLGHVITRSEEAAENGGANPFSIAASAVNDSLGAGKVYESVTNQSQLTGKDLKLSKAERAVGAFTGIVDLLMNAAGVNDLVTTPTPSFKPPTEPTPTVKPSAAAEVNPPHELPSAAGAGAKAGPSAAEIQQMKDKGITYLPDYKAAKEAAKAAEEAKAAESVGVMEEPKRLELQGQQEQPMAAAGGGGGRARISASGGNKPTGPAQTNKATSSRGGGGKSIDVSRTNVSKRIGPGPGTPPPSGPARAAYDAKRAEDVAESLEQLKNRGSGTPIEEGDVPAENIRRSRTIRPTEYDPSVGDSELLGRRLARSGRRKPGPGYQAHHIVPSNEELANEVPNFLRERGFTDNNDPDNGVWLPTGKQTGNMDAEFMHDFTFGSGGYNDEYFHMLEDVLMADPKITPAQIRDRLRWIRSYLEEGKMPPREYPTDPNPFHDE